MLQERRLPGFRRRISCANSNGHGIASGCIAARATIQAGMRRMASGKTRRRRGPEACAVKRIRFYVEGMHTRREFP
jgi:hypothetical protein